MATKTSVFLGLVKAILVIAVLGDLGFLTVKAVGIEGKADETLTQIIGLQGQAATLATTADATLTRVARVETAVTTANGESLLRASLDDTDGDGLKNYFDPCPEEADDNDGFQDEDGCPEADNDGDDVLDVNDKCPNQAHEVTAPEGAPEGWAYAGDGCPPAPDQDKDGVPDAADWCKATDDGFEGEEAAAAALAANPALKAGCPLSTLPRPKGRR